MRIEKRFLIFLIAFITITLFLFPIKVNADTIDNTIKGADDFVDKGDLSTINETQLKNTSDFIYNALLAIGIVATVIIGMILGIKYMVADSADKAEIKETLVPYIVSCCVIFGGFIIWKIVVNILK